MQRVSLDFCETVYDMVRLIPKGSVLGYKDVACAIGFPRRARHVGFALSVLPPELTQQDACDCVPWWRVIRSDGSIAMQGDVHRGMQQKTLLSQENVLLRSSKVDMKTYRWNHQ